jgi:WS/DGAT/MGAT family acyltransferase
MFWDRLSALDASFLALETSESHMHVAATLLFEAGPLRTADGGLDVERIRAHVASRLHLIPRYRQRLAWTPWYRHPVWVDDPRFNLFYHVRHTSLPRPGDLRRLKRLCGRILSQKLDPTKPLWELWVVEGVEGDRFALIGKVHHCMVDGVAGVDLLTLILRPSPDAGLEATVPWVPRRAPGPARLLAHEAAHRAALPLRLLGAAAAAARRPFDAAERALRQASATVGIFARGFAPTSATPLNVRIGPHRRFDWVRMDLDAVKRVKARLGGTVNDVVLAVAVGALRRFLVRRGVDPGGVDLRAMVPVSVRVAAERGALGNRVANFLADLPMREPDPAARLARITATTDALKQSGEAAAEEVFEQLGDWTTTAVVSELMRLATRLRAYNVVVSNVPGPPVPLWLLGAKLEAAYPMVPLFENQAIGFALFSYAGGLFWGLSADWDEVPDLHEVATALEAELDVLVRLAERRASTAA